MLVTIKRLFGRVDFVSLFILGSVLLACGAQSTSAQSIQFSDYPATESFSGAAVPFNETSAPESWSAVGGAIKDIIKEEMAGGPNFAGAYYLATVGCGSGCEAIFVIDLRNGKIFAFPEGAINGVLFQKDSRLIIFKEDAFYDIPRKYILFDGALFGELN